MSKERPDLVDILHDLVKGDDIQWDGAYCLYKEYNIVSVEMGNAVWVRRSMPDYHAVWLRPEDPNFFRHLEAAVILAKQVIDEVEETKKALAGLRDHMLGSKPGSGPVA